MSEEEKFSNKRKLCGWCFLMLWLAVLAQFAILIISFTTKKTDIDDNSNLLVGVKKSLQTPFVTKVAQRLEQTDKAHLNSTETQLKAFYIYWPGTTGGCDCLGVTSCRKKLPEMGKLVPETYKYNEDDKDDVILCSSAAASCGCTVVKETYEANLTKLAGSEFDRILNKDLSFASVYEIIREDYTCPKGHKLCQRYSSSDYSYCVPGDECPLTDLRITRNSTNPDPSLFDSTSYVESKAGTFLWYSRAGKGGPITDLKLSQQSPCFDSGLTTWNSSRPDFPLNVRHVRKCEADKRYINLNDPISERLLFSLNKADHRTIDLVDPSDPQWSKYYRAVFPIKNSCKKWTKDILSSKISFSDLWELEPLSVALWMIKLFFLCLLSAFLSQEESYSKESTRNILISFNIQLVFNSLTFILTYMPRWHSKNLISKIKELISGSCTDSLGIEAFKSFLHQA